MIFSPLLNQFPGIIHSFGTRGEGLALTEKENVLLLNQVHGTTIHILRDTRYESRDTKLEGDAMITDQPGVAIGIKTADCVPVLLCATQHTSEEQIEKTFAPRRCKGVIGAIHCGWRSTMKGMAAVVMETLKRDFQIRPEDVYLAIGPAIHVECYEIGEEMIKGFTDIGLSHRLKEKKKGSGPIFGGLTPFLLDLPNSVADLFRREGVRPENIEVSDLCTYCRDDLFFSYRRDGAKTGRQVNFIRLL